MFKNEIKKGTVQLIVLSLVERQPMYGYEIIQHVHKQTDGTFKWNEAALYPTLYRLEGSGLLSSYWEDAPGRRRRKYYSLTPKGKRALATQRAEWQTISALVT